MASIIISTTSALSIAVYALSTEYFSILSYILFFFLIPAVSINVYSLPFITHFSSIASLVVPAIGDTIVLSSPIIAFKSDDLPAFGFPIMATFVDSSSSNISSSFGNNATTSSNKSPMPSPCDEDIAYIQSKPN